MRFSEFQNSNVAMWGIYVRCSGIVYAHTNAVDGNKNVSEVLDESGNIVAHYEYAAFGDAVIVSGEKALANPFRFSSEYADDALGLTYYNYRHLDHAAGRWLSRDPIEEQGGWNLYGLCGNCVLNTIDALGKMKVFPVNESPSYSEESDFWFATYFEFDKNEADGYLLIKRQIEYNLCNCDTGDMKTDKSSIITPIKIGSENFSKQVRSFTINGQIVKRMYFEIASLPKYACYKGFIKLWVSFTFSSSSPRVYDKEANTGLFGSFDKEHGVKVYDYPPNFSLKDSSTAFFVTLGYNCLADKTDITNIEWLGNWGRSYNDRYSVDINGRRSESDILNARRINITTYGVSPSYD